MLGKTEIGNYALLTLPYRTGPGGYSRAFRASRSHPMFAWLGLRPVLAQHTFGEHEALQRWASDRSTVVEIGVAEGVSALALRQSMASSGTLHLIDPFHFSRNRILNFTKRTAHQLVGRVPRGNVTWIERFSFDAARNWNLPINLLFIDGDHTEEGVRRDWNDWHGFVVPGGIVVFHDARLFDGGWTGPDYGPVRLVDSLFRTKQSPNWKIVEEIHSLVVVERLN